MQPRERPPTYHAFISYSHRDAGWATWLHRSLETYRMPRRLVGRPSRDGRVPKRIYPVFRDREELPGSADLGQNIASALARSRYLVVVCSPRSAVSRWVNEEIRTFKASQGEDRVLCLVVDGEPNATDRPDCGLLECFPEALRHRVGRDRSVLPERAEPIAADARPEGDGKHNARLKLIAGLTGVAYDELRQRERRRQRVRRVQLAGVVALVAAALLGVWRIGEQRALESRRSQHRQMAELMLQKTRDALALRREAVATLYAAHTIHQSLLAGDPPPEVDLLSSLSPPALIERTLAETPFERALAVSPDGELLAVAGRDGAVRIFRPASGEPVVTLEACPGALLSVDFRPDGTALAAGGSDGRVYVWRVPAAEDRTSRPWPALEAHETHTGGVLRLAWAPAGAVLASGGEDGQIVLRDLASGAGLELAAHSAEVNAVAFSPDGAWLASGGQDNALRLWRADGQPVATLATYRQPVMSVAFHPRGEMLAVAVRDGSTKLWDLHTRTEQAALGADRLAVLDVAFSPDGELVAAAGRNRTVALWEVATGDLLTTLVGHDDEVWSVRFVTDGHALASGSRDGTVKLWRVAPRESVATLAGHGGAIRGVDVSPDGRTVASCADDGEIRLWDLEQRRPLRSLIGHDNSVRAVAFSPDGSMLASAGTDKTLRLWDVATGRERARVAAHDKWVVDLAFREDGRVLATAGWDHTARLWSVPELSLERTLVGHSAEVSGVAFSRDGRLASVSYDSSVKLWDAATGASLATLIGHERHVRTVDFSPDGSRLLSGGWDRWARIWDVSTSTTTGSFLGHHSQEIWMLRFSPDGRLIACATPSHDRHTLRIFDAATGAIVTRLSGHDEYALAVAFTPDGRWLISGGADAVLRIWRVADFWPPREDAHTDDPGEVVRRFLARTRHEPRDAAALAERISAMTGLELRGTEVVPGERGP